MPGRSHESKVKRLPGEYSVEDVALFNLTLFADYVWSTSSLDVHREACQKTWVKFNRIREAGQRTSVLDLLAEIRVDQRKTVRDTIPFSRLAKYGNYEYDEESDNGGLVSCDVTSLAFEERCLTGEGCSGIHWSHNSAFNSIAAENIVQNQLVREANEKVEGIDYAQQLEYTAYYHKDPSLGRGQDPPIGSFGRLCGAFDPIKFNGLVREILKPEPTASTSKSEERLVKDAYVPWINWLLCVYPEFLQSLCSRADFAHLMTPDIEMSIDFLEILDKPVSAFDIHQFPKPKLRSWNRCRQGVRRLFQQITSQEVQRLWLCDELLVDNRTRLGITASEEEVVLRPLDSSSSKGTRERIRRSDRPTWIKKSPHVTSGHRKETRKNLHNNEGDKCKDKDKLDHHVVAGLKTTGTTRTPSAPTLTELNFEDFPTLSEAATMNFRLPVVAPGPPKLRPHGVQKDKKSTPFDCHVEWGLFVGTPLQRNIHSKSDTDLHRSASQGSNSQSSPLSDNSLGLRSESDSDLQLQESFRRRESEAQGLLRSVTSGQSTSSEESCVSPSSMQMTDDGRMNIHAPSFRPREHPSRQQLITLTSSVSLVTNGQSKNSLRTDMRQPNANTRHWTTQVQQLQQQQPQVSAQQSLTDPSAYSARRASFTFPQPPAHWRQPFPVLCKPPPGFESLCMVEGPTSLTLPSPQTQSAPPPQMISRQVVNANQQFFQQNAPSLNQYSTSSAASVNTAGRPTFSFFPQAYSNQVDMFPYHNSLFADQSQRIGSTQSSPRQGPTTPTTGASLTTSSVAPPTTMAQVSLPDPQVSMPDSSNYVMSMPQFACPLGFPNQIFPRYLMPPAVRMPNPQQFLPSMPPPPQHQTQGTFPTSSGEVPFGWARFPQGPLTANSTGFHISPQNHFIQSYGFNQFPALPVSFPGSDGVQQQFHPLTWFPPQSRYKTFVQPITTSGNNFTQETPLTSRDETRDFGLTRGSNMWRNQRPTDTSVTSSSLSSGLVSFPIDAIGTSSLSADDGRKTRPRKRDPTNLVHLVGADSNHGRRERNRRPRCRLGRGIMSVHDCPLLCDQRGPTSENEESSEEWALDPTAAEGEDFSDVTDVVMTDQVLVDSLPGCRTRQQRSLNTSESSRSSEPELLDELNSPEKCTGDSGKLTSRYRSYKDCLQTTGIDIDGSQSRPDMDKLDSCRSSLGSIPRSGQPLSNTQTGSASFTSSPEKDGRPTSSLDDTFCGQTNSPSCGSPPLIMTPPRSYVATPTLLCSPPSCEPEALESALLQHLAKWSAVKMATEAEEIGVNETQNTFGFRWIPEDDLERQAAEEYCPSKENSHEKLAHGSVHSNLDRSASRGRASSSNARPAKHESSGGGGGGGVVDGHLGQGTTAQPPLPNLNRFPPKSIEDVPTNTRICKTVTSKDGCTKMRSKRFPLRERSQSLGSSRDKSPLRIPVELVRIGDDVEIFVEPSRGRKRKLCRKTKPKCAADGDHRDSPLTEKQVTERTLKKLSLIAEIICPSTAGPRDIKRTGGYFNGTMSKKKNWSPKILANTNIDVSILDICIKNGTESDQSSEVTDGNESPINGHQRVMESFLSSATGFVKRLVFNAL